MKCAVLYSPFDLRLEERPVPEITHNEVLIKVKAAGICGSDVHFFDGSHPYRNYPRVHGHELSGIVEKTGVGVENVKVGDHVVVEPLIFCGKCFPCRMGKYNCCVNLQVIGAHVDGGFAEYVKVPSHLAHKIPAEMPFDLAATCEPYSIGYHSTHRAQITAADKVLVLGAGAIGLTAVDFAKLTGATVFVAEVSPFRQNLARKFGADVIIDPSKENTEAKIREFTNGEGVGVVIEATGVVKVMESTENLVAAGGRIVIAGLTNDKVAFTGIKFTNREMTILGTRNSAGEFPAVIDAIASGKTHSDMLITKRFPFQDIVNALNYTAANIAIEGKVIIEF
jgi:L-gulonate 5-dehydrogenase